MTITTIDLRTRVADILNSCELADPVEVAELVLRDLDLEQRADVAVLLLPGLVADVMGSQRRAVRRADIPEQQTVPSYVGVTVDPIDTSIEVPAIPATRTRPSWKVRGRRARRECILASRIRGADGWLLLGKATVADLIAAAGKREALAAGNLVEAERFRALAKVMLEAGVQTVDGLDDESLATYAADLDA